MAMARRVPSSAGVRLCRIGDVRRHDLLTALAIIAPSSATSLPTYCWVLVNTPLDIHWYSPSTIVASPHRLIASLPHRLISLSPRKFSKPNHTEPVDLQSARFELRCSWMLSRFNQSTTLKIAKRLPLNQLQQHACSWHMPRRQ